MKDESKVLSILDTGMEQRPGHPHQASMLDMFHNGDYVEMPTPMKGSKWPRTKESNVTQLKAPRKDSQTSSPDL
jgi:hypothetical protein